MNSLTRRVLAAGVVLAALPAGVGVSVAASSWGGPPPGCKPSHDTPPKCHTTSTETVTEPGTTSTVTVTTPGTTTTVTTPAPPAPPPTVVVTPGPVNNTVTITITINGSTSTTTVPGTVPGTLPGCVSRLTSAKLGPLPVRYARVQHVDVRIGGEVQFRSVLPGRRVNVNLAGLACGTYPIVVNDVPNKRSIRPVLRIWELTGGTGLRRVGFPLPVPPIGLS
jgi:hypothetical protein